MGLTQPICQVEEWGLGEPRLKLVGKEPFPANLIHTDILVRAFSNILVI
jgi:hypothetical protein